MTTPSINYQALQFWFLVLVQVGNAIVWVAGYLILRQKATAGEIQAVAKQVTALQTSQAESCSKHQARTTTLEERAKNARTHADIGQVHDRVTSVKGGVDELKGMLKGVITNVTLLVEHHLNGGNPK